MAPWQRNSPSSTSSLGSAVSSSSLRSSSPTSSSSSSSFASFGSGSEIESCGDDSTCPLLRRDSAQQRPGSRIQVHSFTCTTQPQQQQLDTGVAGGCTAVDETQRGVRVSCPGLRATATFHLEGAEPGNSVSVGFLQVVERSKVTATYASPTGRHDYQVVPVRCLRRPPSTLPFFGPESEVARVQESDVYDSPPHQPTDRQSNGLGSCLSNGDTSPSIIRTISIDHTPAFELPWSVRGDASQSPASSCAKPLSGGDSRGRSDVNPFAPASQGSAVSAGGKRERLDLACVEYDFLSTTWLAVHDSYARTLVPVCAVQHTARFQLSVSAGKVLGSRALACGNGGGVSEVRHLHPVPRIPGGALENLRQSASPADSSGRAPPSLHWHGMNSGRVALQPIAAVHQQEPSLEPASAHPFPASSHSPLCGRGEDASPLSRVRRRQRVTRAGPSGQTTHSGGSRADSKHLHGPQGTATLGRQSSSNNGNSSSQHSPHHLLSSLAHRICTVLKM